jgi:NADH-quinone oxidoreductase subunit K
MNTPLPLLFDRLDIYLVAGAFLLAVGIYGLIRRRTLIGMLISGELIFSAASLNLMAFNRFSAPDPVVGQVFVLFIMGLAAAEVAIALSIIIAVYRNYRSVKTQELSELEG